MLLTGVMTRRTGTVKLSCRLRKIRLLNPLVGVMEIAICILILSLCTWVAQFGE